ncbi:glycosyltransferase family 8 protein [Campylobacter coli]
MKTKENTINLVFTTDNKYLIYLAVVLESIITHSDKNHFYDVYIIYTHCSKQDFDKVLFKFKNQSNFLFKLYDINEALERNRDLFHIYQASHFSMAVYYRFFIPEILKDIDKVIFLDIDIVVLNDLKYLYNIDLKDNVLAACIDVCMLLDGNLENSDQKNYCLNTLNMNNIDNYFNAGILVFNLEKCREIEFLKICLQKLQELQKPRLNDQCVFNSLFNDKCKILPLKWNWIWNVSIRHKNTYLTYTPKELLEEWLETQKDPYIIHYNDYFKPWNSPHLPKADIWWQYARQTPFYEEILFKNIKDFTFKKLPSNYTNSIQVKPYGAVEKIKTHLSYKLGNEILSVKEKKTKVFILPFILIFISAKHKISNWIYKLILDLNPNPTLKSLPLSYYSDYHEAMKIKNYLSYKLGNLLIKHPFTFIFRIGKVYREWKEGK